MRVVRRFLPILVISGLLLAPASAAISAQTTSTQSATDREAGQVREDFMKVLERYPPAVGAVLRFDPSLLASESYISSYPAIAEFLKQHPEVLKSPSFYLEQVRASTSYSSLYSSRDRAWDTMTEMAAVFFVVVTIVGTLAWLIRTAVDYRRWGRLAKVQAEAHTKLLDRFTANDELLAYVQSPAGARFLQSAPITLDGNARSAGSPVSRILWSIQAGVVLAAAGIGMNYVSRHIEPDRADPVFMFSVILLAVGIGFVASSGISLVLSKRLGLIVENGRDGDA